MFSATRYCEDNGHEYRDGACIVCAKRSAEAAPECDCCGFDLEPHERVLRGDGRMYCAVCVGRFTDTLEPIYAEWTDYLPA